MITVEPASRNVIPGTAELRLTVRAMQPDVRDLLEKRITEIATAQAQTFGARAEVNYIRRYPVLQNDPAQTAFCLDLVRDWLGDKGIVDKPEPVTASEDFAFFLEKVPGCYFNIGNGAGEGAKSKMSFKLSKGGEDMAAYLATIK